MDYTYYVKFWLSGFWKSKKLITDKANSIYEINFEKLYLEGARLIVFDVDDTIGEHKGQISEKTINLFMSLSERGWKLVLFSNCTEDRREELTEYFTGVNVSIYGKGGKPNPMGFLEICKMNKISVKKSIMIGEKLATDIFGSYLAGYKYRIIVNIYSKVFEGNKSTFFERFIRRLENSLI